MLHTLTSWTGRNVTHVASHVTSVTCVPHGKAL